MLSDLRNRLRSPWPALDVHVHPLDCFGFHKVNDVKEDAQLLLASANRSGVAKMCLFSLHTACPREPSVAECKQANDYALAMRDEAPDVFLPFCYVNPMYPEEAVLEIERCVERERMCGVKLWVAVRATDQGLDPILEKAVELGVPILQHAWIKTTGNLVGESFPLDVADLARRHPEAKIVMAHLNGVGLRGIEDIADTPNVVVDTSGGDPESGIIEAAVQVLGRDRVVFGSDAPIRHFGVTLGKVLGAEIPEEVKQDILWHNTARLLPDWANLSTPDWS